MSPVIAAALAAETAKLVRLVDAPVGELGYGRDLACAQDLTEDFEEIDENSPQAIGQAIFRRWTTPRGQLQDDQEYGEDIVGMLNKGLTAAYIAEKAGRLKLEALKDDRVQDCTVTITPSPRGDEIRVQGVITPADPSAKRFSMTLAVVNGQGLLAELVAL
jgi:hypothetical protein